LGAFIKGFHHFLSVLEESNRANDSLSIIYSFLKTKGYPTTNSTTILSKKANQKLSKAMLVLSKITAHTLIIT